MCSLEESPFLADIYAVVVLLKNMTHGACNNKRKIEEEVRK